MTELYAGVPSLGRPETAHPGDLGLPAWMPRHSETAAMPSPGRPNDRALTLPIACSASPDRFRDAMMLGGRARCGRPHRPTSGRSDPAAAFDLTRCLHETPRFLLQPTQPCPASLKVASNLAVLPGASDRYSRTRPWLTAPVDRTAKDLRRQALSLARGAVVQLGGSRCAGSVPALEATYPEISFACRSSIAVKEATMLHSSTALVQTGGCDAAHRAHGIGTHLTHAPMLVRCRVSRLRRDFACIADLRCRANPGVFTGAAGTLGEAAQ